MSETIAEVVAKRIGIRPDQVARAVEEFKAVADERSVEPNWRAIMHMSGRGTAISQFGADDTAVTLQIDGTRARGQWVQERAYVYAGKRYDHFARAAEAEQLATARFRPAAVATAIPPVDTSRTAG